MARIAEEGLTAEEYYRYSLTRAPSRHASRIAASLAASGASLALEIGCGAGLSLAHIAGHSAPDIFCVGCDVDMEMLRYAAKNKSPRLAWIQNDDATLPFSDNSFDFVFSEGSLHHFSEPENVFSEMMRVLKPGGEALIMDINPESFFARAYRIFADAKSRLGIASPGEKALALSIAAARREKDVRAMFDACGAKCETSKTLAALYYTAKKPAR